MRAMTAQRHVVRFAVISLVLLAVGLPGAPAAHAWPILTTVDPNLSLAFDQKIQPVPGTTQWIYKVTNSGATTAYNVKFSFTFQHIGQVPPGTSSGSFAIAKVPNGATWDVAVTCNDTPMNCKNSTLKIQPGNYLIKPNQGQASAP
jgi:hypothetical protein